MGPATTSSNVIALQNTHAFVRLGADMKTANRHQTRMPVQGRYFTILKHLEEFCGPFNAAAAGFSEGTMPLLSFTTVVKDMPISDYADEFVAAWQAGRPYDARGYMGHADTIKTVAEIVSAMWNDRDKIAVSAPMQSGKTGMICMTQLIWRTLQTTSGRRCFVTTVPYGRRGPTEETLKDLQAALCVYGNLEFGPDSPTLRACNSQTHHRNHEKGHQRTSVAHIEAMIKDAFSQGYDDVTILIDEADHGSSSRSPLAKLFHRAEALARKQGIRLRFVFFSATPYEFLGLDEFHSVEVEKKPGGGYRGVVQGDPLHIHAMDEVAAHCGIPNLDDTFRISRNGVRRIDEVCRLIKAFANGIDAPHIGLNGKPMNGGNTIVVRFGTQTQIDALARHLKSKRHASLKLNVIHFYGAGLTGKDGRPLTVSEALAGGENNLFILKGAGRRADRFPSECAVFLDFTDKYTTAEAFYQGLIGRACGYKPDNVFVMVSHQNMEIVRKTRDYFRLTGYDVPWVKSMRAMLVQGVRSARDIDRKTLCLDELPRNIAGPIIASLRRFVSPLLTGGNKTPIRLRTAKVGEAHRSKAVEIDGGVYRFDYYALLGGLKHVRAIEDYLSAEMKNPVQLLVPGMVRPDGKRFEIGVGDNHVRIAVGNSERNEARGGQDGSNRDERRKGKAQRGADARESANLRPDVLFEHAGDDYEPKQVLLFFQTPVRDLSKVTPGMVHKPTRRSAYARFRNTNEIAAVVAAGGN